MKSKILSAAIMSASMFLMSSCGPMGSAGQTTTVNNPNQMGQMGGSLGQTLLGLLSGALVPTESQIVGTWVYQSPAVVFTSDNALATLGSSVVSSGIEGKMQTYLAKYGITNGNMSFTFNTDKTFTMMVKGKSIPGTYSIAGQTVLLTFAGFSQPSRLTPQLTNGSLVIVTDASKIKNFVQGMGAASNSSELNAITSLMNQFNGMQLGIRMQKR